MSLFNRNKRGGGFMDEIRCDEPSYLVWRWHPSGVQSGETARESAIRWGSSLRVKDGEVAVFVYQQADGTLQDFIPGPFDQIIKTANFPVLSSIIGLVYEGGTPFPAEIYFINLARIIQIRFGVPFFDVYDPRFADYGVPIAVRGTISFSITDYRTFIKLHRLSSFSLDDFQREIRDAVNRHVKDAVANAPAAYNIPVVQLEGRTAQINDAVERDLGERLKEDFGVAVSSIDIGAIEMDKSSDGYRQLMAVTRDVAAARIHAETQDYVEHLRIQREEGQYALRKQTQTANIGAFQVEKQAEVSVAGANALAQMGASGAGSANIGSDGAGLNMAAMMASMAVGGAVGQNIANAMNGMMGGLQAQAAPGAVPPPIPAAAYHVAVDGQPTGPFDLAALAQMARAGRLTADSLVWKCGMTQWAKAGTIDELSSLLGSGMPPVPPDTV